MRPTQPILVNHLFPEILDALLDLLEGLSPADWQQPTACEGWTVHDVALHLLGDDLGLLSRRRDGHVLPVAAEGWEALVALINRLNWKWVEAARRLSPPVVIDLLRFSGPQVSDYFASLDPLAVGGPVSWAGPEPAPVWLDLAREYTERWHHQQHIRDALGKPGLQGPRHLAPVIATFMHALPHTFGTVEAAEGTMVAVAVSGPAGSTWFLQRRAGGWMLGTDAASQPQARVAMPEAVAWRLFTRGIDREAALAQMTCEGDRALGLVVLDAIAIIA